MSEGRARPMDAAAWDARYASRELVWSAEPNRLVVEELDDLAPAGPATDDGVRVVLDCLVRLEQTG